MNARRKHRAAPRARQEGSILIEGLVSVLIFSLGVIALIGMQTLSISESLHGKYRTDAAYLANEIIGEMTLDKNNVASYADAAGTASANRTAWDARVAAQLPNGDTAITMDGASVTIVVSWRNPNETASHSHRTIAQVAF